MTFSKTSPSAFKNTKSTKVEPTFCKKFVISSFKVTVFPVNRLITLVSNVTSFVTGDLFKAAKRAVFLAAFEESKGDIENIVHT